jgi:hypothetical protein
MLWLLKSCYLHDELLPEKLQDRKTKYKSLILLVPVVGLEPTRF